MIVFTKPINNESDATLQTGQKLVCFVTSQFTILYQRYFAGTEVIRGLELCRQPHDNAGATSETLQNMNKLIGWDYNHYKANIPLRGVYMLWDVLHKSFFLFIQ